MNAANAASASVHEHRAIVFRLHPGSRAKHRQLARTAGACRKVWNHFLARNRRDYARWAMWDTHRRAGLVVGAEPPKPAVSAFSLFKAFTRLRAETPWLAELPFHPVRYALKYQADAWAKAFRGEAGRPKFKGRRGDDSFTIPQDVKLKDGAIRIPKVGLCRLSRRGGNPYADCPPAQATVKRVLGRWHCVVLYRVEAPEASAPPQAAAPPRAVGIDMNAGQIALSTGEILRMPDVSRLEARRRRHQRMVARRKKGSKRRALARRRLARTQRRIANVRHRWQHEASRAIADRFGFVAIEDLRVRAMTESAKGTAENPGTGVRAKARLNRAILGTGWGQFRRMLEYKCAEVVAVDPAYTSRTCAECAGRDPGARRGKKFKCPRCGHEAHADANAARNILARALRATGRGDGGISRSVKRQKIYARDSRAAVNLSI